MSVPKLRFKADDGSMYPEWEEKKLGEVCEQLKVCIDPQKNPNKYFVEYSMPAFDENQSPQLVLGSRINSTRKVILKPCVLINKLNVRKKRIWHVTNPEENAVCSSEFVPLSSNQLCLAFLTCVALTKRFTNYLLDCSSGSSNSQKRVTPDDIMNYDFSIPSLPEQRKIAAFLSAIDTQLELSKSELSKWEQFKKGMLQKIFRQEIRFKADDGSEFPEWEEKTFSEILSENKIPIPKPTNGYERLGIRSHGKGTFHEYVPAGK